MNQKPLACVILAAGKGTRMKSGRPKVLHTLAGLPMVQWLLRSAEQLKPEKIIVVTGPDMKDLEKAVQPHICALQPEPNGTGGALKAAMPALKGFKGDVLVLLGDAPLLSASTLKTLVRARNADLLSGLSVLGVDLPDPKGYGRLILDKDGALTKIVEDKDASAKEKRVTLCNTGAFCIDGARLPRWLEALDNRNAQGEYYITDLVAIAAQDTVQTAVTVTADAAEVQGCNTRADLAKLERTAQKRLREAAMLGGATLPDPESVYFHHDTKTGKEVVIEPQVVFGPGVKIMDNATIRSFSHIEGATIKSGAVVGPFARVRPDTVIEEEARIGNFVEIKKSKIGRRSKINHLAYVGDCTMGADTNFSAGAITVNYDGFQKHQTIIGKGVMVGSNVNLVAPLSIDDGAFIAAGSTITEDVPADALSFARSKAEIRQGWAAAYRKRKAARRKKAS